MLSIIYYVYNTEGKRVFGGFRKKIGIPGSPNIPI